MARDPGERPAQRAGSTIVRVRDAKKAYGVGGGVVHALDGVDVDLRRGEFTAIMGPSGSGKSTLLQCAAGLDALTSGSVEVDGIELGSLSDRDLTLLRRRRFGFVFQSFNLVPTLTLVENIMLPLQLAGQGVHEPWFDEVVAMLGIADCLVHRPGQLSGGQQQRAAVARALVSRPDVVFADEPTGNLDSASGADLLGLLRRAVDEHDQTMVLVSHDPFAAAHADRVLFLVDGRVVDELADPTPERILQRMGDLPSRAAAPAATDRHADGDGDGDARVADAAADGAARVVQRAGRAARFRQLAREARASRERQAGTQADAAREVRPGDANAYADADAAPDVDADASADAGPDAP